MRSPTVSKLFGEAGYAVETVVPKSEINVLIPELKERAPLTSSSSRSRRSFTEAGRRRHRGVGLVAPLGTPAPTVIGASARKIFNFVRDSLRSQVRAPEGHGWRPRRLNERNRSCRASRWSWSPRCAGCRCLPGVFSPAGGREAVDAHELVDSQYCRTPASPLRLAHSSAGSGVPEVHERNPSRIGRLRPSPTPRPGAGRDRPQGLERLGRDGVEWSCPAGVFLDGAVAEFGARTAFHTIAFDPPLPPRCSTSSTSAKSDHASTWTIRSGHRAGRAPAHAS